MGYHYKLGDDYVLINAEPANTNNDNKSGLTIHSDLTTTLEKNGYSYNSINAGDINYPFFKYSETGYEYTTINGKIVWVKAKDSAKPTRVGVGLQPLKYYYNSDNELFVVKNRNNGGGFYLPYPQIDCSSNGISPRINTNNDLNWNEFDEPLIIEQNTSKNKTITLTANNTVQFPYDENNYIHTYSNPNRDAVFYIIAQAAGGDGGVGERSGVFTDAKGGGGGGSGAWCTFFGRVWAGDTISITIDTAGNITFTNNKYEICKCTKGSNGKRESKDSQNSGGSGGEFSKASETGSDGEYDYAIRYVSCINGEDGNYGGYGGYDNVGTGFYNGEQGCDCNSVIVRPMYQNSSGNCSTHIFVEGGAVGEIPDSDDYVDCCGGGGGSSIFGKGGTSWDSKSFTNYEFTRLLNTGFYHGQGYGAGGAGASSGVRYIAYGESNNTYRDDLKGNGGKAVVMIWMSK